MSDLVERLAERWDEYISTVEPQPTMELPQIEARWWIQAIADEVEKPGLIITQVGTKRYRECAQWLRSQAKENVDG